MHTGTVSTCARQATQQSGVDDGFDSITAAHLPNIAAALGAAAASKQVPSPSVRLGGITSMKLAGTCSLWKLKHVKLHDSSRLHLEMVRKRLSSGQVPKHNSGQFLCH